MSNWRDSEIRRILDACVGGGAKGTGVTFGYEALYDAVGGLVDERQDLRAELVRTYEESGKTIRRLTEMLKQAGKGGGRE